MNQNEIELGRKPPIQSKGVFVQRAGWYHYAFEHDDCAIIFRTVYRLKKRKKSIYVTSNMPLRDH